MIELEVWSGRQVVIQQRNANGSGHGYRIAGGSVADTDRRLVSHQITERDATEIRRYLDAGYPAATFTEIDGVAWCVTHDSWWVEGETQCHDASLNWPDADDFGCAEVPLYRGQP